MKSFTSIGNSSLHKCSILGKIITTLKNFQIGGYRVKKILVPISLVWFIIIIPTLYSNQPNLSRQLQFGPKIVSVKTQPPSTNGYWVNLEKEGKGELIIQVEAVNTKKVRFWLMPKGTGTWSLRKLIGEDNEQEDGWGIVWSYDGNKTFHHNIVVEAIDTEGNVTRESINVSNSL
jgi:hypothetical protein